METLAHVGTCPGMRYATANVALGDTPIWGRRQPATMHTHPLYILEFVKHGRILFADGERNVELGPGWYYVTAPGMEHSHGVQTDVATMHIAFRPEFIRRIAAEAAPGTGPGVLHFPGPARQASPQLEAQIRRICQEGRQVAPWRRMLIDSLATELVIQLIRDHGIAVAAEQQDGSDGVTRAIEMILANYDRDLSLDALSAEAGVSRFHFVRVFRERVGNTPGAYLRQVRLEHATDLLRTSDLSVTEIALRCGFAGPNRLAEVIRRHYGMAPSELRGARVKRHGEGR